MEFDIKYAFKALNEIDDNEKPISKIRQQKLNEAKAARQAKLNNKLNEEMTYNLADTQDLEDAKQHLKDLENEDRVEQVIDIEAEKPEELKDTYVGSIILQCPTCKSLYYRNEEDIVYPEPTEGEANAEDKEGVEEKDEAASYVNKGEECVNCGAEDGYIIIGKVAPLDANAESKEEKEEESEPSEEEPEEEDKEEASEESEEKPEESEDRPRHKEESEEDREENKVKEALDIDNLVLENVDDIKFNKLIEMYLNRVYENVKSFTTTSAGINNKTIVLEGNINFKSGKTKATKFIFEAKEVTRKGKLKLHGLNETFSNSKSAFVLTATVENRDLVTESLVYNYNIKDNEESKKLYGRVVFPVKK